MNHEIHVDPERADEILERIGQQAAAEEFQRDKKFNAGQAAMETAESEPESWLTFAGKSVDFTAAAICPAWELTADEKGQLSLSVAELLDHYFPGAVEGFDQWSPWAKLAGTMFFIAAIRIDYDTWRLAPLRKVSNNESTATGRPDDTDDGQEPERKNGGNFTIGA